MHNTVMCTGEACKVKKTCFRFIAKPNKVEQPYFPKPPGKDSSCEDYQPAFQDEIAKYKERIA